MPVATHTKPSGLRLPVTPDAERLRHSVDRLGRRFTRFTFWRNAFIGLFWGLAVALGYAICERLLFATAIPLAWGIGLPVLMGAGVALVVTLRHGRTVPLVAAVRADAHFELAERISTAYVLAARPLSRPFEAAAVDDAVARARMPLGPVARFQFPWQAAASVGVALGVAALVIFGPFGARLFDPDPADPKPDSRVQADLLAATTLLTANRKPLQRLAEKVGYEETGQLLKEINALAARLEARRGANDQGIDEAERRDDMADLSDLEERARNARDKLSAMADAADAAKQNRAGKDGSGDGAKQSKDFQDALAKGEFAQAAKALQDLQDKLDTGKLTPEQQKALGAELEQLASKMPPGSSMKQQLSQLADQLQSGKPFTANQQQQLDSKLSQMQQQLGQLGDRPQLDLNREMLEMLESQLGACRGAMGEKPGAQGGKPGAQGGKPGQGQGGKPSGKPGGQGGKPGALIDKQRARLMQMLGGTGGRGQGGGRPGEADGDALPTDATRFRTQLRAGEILDMTYRMGIPETGESNTRYAESARRARLESEDALSKDGVPPDRRRFVRDYFDRINPGLDGKDR